MTYTVTQKCHLSRALVVTIALIAPTYRGIARLTKTVRPRTHFSSLLTRLVATSLMNP